MVLIVAAFTLNGAPSMSAETDRYAEQRRRMLEEIAQNTRETAVETGRPHISERVMAALAKVPRHRFVSAADERAAYDNRPLSIGSGQTISQPFIVALMTEVLEVQPGNRILEIGTGSGYQAAVLAELAQMVYTVEIVEPLAREASRRLSVLGYRNIVSRVGDGYQGWPEHAPFDGIIVTAAAREVPQPLIEQLRNGGRMVIPLGAPGGEQTLYVVEKTPEGKLVQRAILGVRFVPLTRQH
jgi:protein-L-isoaspartate(D-aspartate) O-methyltransferase